MDDDDPLPDLVAGVTALPPDSGNRLFNYRLLSGIDIILLGK